MEINDGSSWRSDYYRASVGEQEQVPTSNMPGSSFVKLFVMLLAPTAKMSAASKNSNGAQDSHRRVVFAFYLG